MTDKKSESPIQRQLFLTTKKIQAADECQYCLKKQKLSTGGQVQRCLQHSLAYQKSFSNETNSQDSGNIIDDVLDLLLQVQQLLQEYWSNLHEYSKGSTDRVLRQLSPIFQSVDRINAKLQRFPVLDDVFVSSKNQKKSRQIYDADQRKQTRSEKFIVSNFNELFEDVSVSDQIKQWVIYYQKILINGEINQQLLPFDDQIGMRIFKESMERKFLNFAKNYYRYEKKLGEALEKLLFYMESCGDKVSDSVIKLDIKFIEEADVPRAGSASIQIGMLLLQALTIEDLLAKAEFM